MCGIAGVTSSRPLPLGAAVSRMNRAQAHRGPDGEGIYVASSSPRYWFSGFEGLDEPARCALGHRRLAILDIEKGQQPMVSEDCNVAVLLNGEIYNFRELRTELVSAGFKFRTDTDSEVILNEYRNNPEEPARWLKKLNGIYAIAIWDNRRNRLLLARDHFGVKPLHYFQDDSRLLFSSEIKALLAAGVAPKLNRRALHVFMNVRYVPGEETLFSGVRRLKPAHYAWVQDGRIGNQVRYYSLNARPDGHIEDADLKRRINEGFSGAVEKQLLSDTPVGMALSGGLDSSMIVASAAESFRSGRNLRLSDKELRTFTLGFNEPTDENDDASVIAKHFGTKHHDMRLAADPLSEAKAVIRAVEEPKINMLQGYALARFVKEHVKVIFSGLGGDELFAGYDVHRYCNTLGRINEYLPFGMFTPMGRLLWHIQSASGILKTEHYRIGAQIALSTGDRTQFYCRLRNAWDFDKGMYRRVYAEPSDFLDLPATGSYFAPYFGSGGSYLAQVLTTEFETKMVNDFLLNEDRVTSAHGVEGRVPFLDREFVELAFSIPASRKMRGRETKTLWKQSIAGRLPDRIINKKKQGFTFSSYHQWLKDLRPVVEKELTREWCEATHIFNYRFVKDTLDYKPHSNLRWHYFMVWMMLNVKQWMEVFDVEA